MENDNFGLEELGGLLRGVDFTVCLPLSCRHHHSCKQYFSCPLIHA